MANNYSHLFITFLGLPPDTTDAPICGANLPADWSVRDRAIPVPCPKCLAEAKRRGLK
jgi:hypothetical protein